MTRERMQTLGLVLGVNLVVTALVVATRVWLDDQAPANSANAAPMLMLEGATPAELFPPLYHYRPEIWGFASSEIDDDQSKLPEKSILRGTRFEQDRREPNDFFPRAITGSVCTSWAPIPFEPTKVVGPIVNHEVPMPEFRPLGQKLVP